MEGADRRRPGLGASEPVELVQELLRGAGERRQRAAVDEAPVPPWGLEQHELVGVDQGRGDRPGRLPGLGGSPLLGRAPALLVVVGARLARPQLQASAAAEPQLVAVAAMVPVRVVPGEGVLGEDQVAEPAALLLEREVSPAASAGAGRVVGGPFPAAAAEPLAVACPGQAVLAAAQRAGRPRQPPPGCCRRAWREPNRHQPESRAWPQQASAAEGLCQVPARKLRGELGEGLLADQALVGITGRQGEPRHADRRQPPANTPAKLARHLRDGPLHRRQVRDGSVTDPPGVLGEERPGQAQQHKLAGDLWWAEVRVVGGLRPGEPVPEPGGPLVEPHPLRPLVPPSGRLACGEPHPVQQQHELVAAGFEVVGAPLEVGDRPLQVGGADLQDARTA